MRGAEVEARAGAGRRPASAGRGGGGTTAGGRPAAARLPRRRLEQAPRSRPTSTVSRPPAGRSQGSGGPGRMLLATRFSAPASSALAGEVDGRPARRRCGPSGCRSAGRRARTPAVTIRSGARRSVERVRAGVGRPAASCQAGPRRRSKRWVSTVSVPSRLQRRSPPSSASAGAERVERQRQREPEVGQELKSQPARPTASRKPRTSAAAWALSAARRRTRGTA